MKICHEVMKRELAISERMVPRIRVRMTSGRAVSCCISSVDFCVFYVGFWVPRFFDTSPLVVRWQRTGDGMMNNYRFAWGIRGGDM
jgi:hypothetical protein